MYAIRSYYAVLVGGRHEGFSVPHHLHHVSGTRIQIVVQAQIEELFV